MSFQLPSTNFVEYCQEHELQDIDLQIDVKRRYHSSGNLGLLWSEAEKFDVINALDCISDCTSEDESPYVGIAKECTNPGEREFLDSKPHSNYVRIVDVRIPSLSSRIFRFGDLNHRIDLPDAEIRHLVALKRWDGHLKYDQLTKELMSGSAFSGWKEGLINFPPTYKDGRNSSRYVGELSKEAKKRSPAWCDRILWLGKGTKQLSYWSSPDLSLSDHRPVSSFSVEVEMFNQRKLERVLNFTNPGFVTKGEHMQTISVDK